MDHPVIDHCCSLQAKERKTNVIIFPEGTRHHSTKAREMLPFKKGAFAAAIASQMPVLPVVVSHYKVNTALIIQSVTMFC